MPLIYGPAICFISFSNKERNQKQEKYYGVMAQQKPQHYFSHICLQAHLRSESLQLNGNAHHQYPSIPVSIYPSIHIIIVPIDGAIVPSIFMLIIRHSLAVSLSHFPNN